MGLVLGGLAGGGAAAGIAFAHASSPEMAQVARAGGAAARQEPGYPFTPYDGRLMFVRIVFDPTPTSLSRFRSREVAWHHDYPFAETNLTSIIRDLTYVRVLRGGNVIRDSDPMLMRFPAAWLAEPGYWTPGDAAVANMRAYLLKGGFLIIDDFSSVDLPHLEEQMRRIVPELRPLDLDGSEPIFHTFFDFDSAGLRLYGYRARYQPERYLGYFEGNDRARRQLVIVDADNDIGEFFEYNEHGFNFVSMTNDAFKLGVNYFVYALTH